MTKNSYAFDLYGFFEVYMGVFLCNFIPLLFRLMDTFI